MLRVIDAPCHVLFVCTGNSARSIIAEALLNARGRGRFDAHSAGSRPSGLVNPLVLEHLAARGIDTAKARSKSWQTFAEPNAPRMDLIITVCDDAAGDACPVWPGAPAGAHWSAPDPAAHMADPARARAVIAEVFDLMQHRIARLVELPVETLDRDGLARAAQAIAREKSVSKQ